MGECSYIQITLANFQKLSKVVQLEISLSSQFQALPTIYPSPLDSQQVNPSILEGQSIQNHPHPILSLW